MMLPRQEQTQNDEAGQSEADVLSVGEVARLLGTTPGAIYAGLRKGAAHLVPPARRRGKKWAFLRAEYKQWLLQLPCVGAPIRRGRGRPRKSPIPITALRAGVRSSVRVERQGG